MLRMGLPVGAAFSRDIIAFTISTIYRLLLTTDY